MAKDFANSFDQKMWEMDAQRYERAISVLTWVKHEGIRAYYQGLKDSLEKKVSRTQT